MALTSKQQKILKFSETSTKKLANLPGSAQLEYFLVFSGWAGPFYPTTLNIRFNKKTLKLDKLIKVHTRKLEEIL